MLRWETAHFPQKPTNSQERFLNNGVPSSLHKLHICCGAAESGPAPNDMKRGTGGFPFGRCLPCLLKHNLLRVSWWCMLIWGRLYTFTIWTSYLNHKPFQLPSPKLQPSSSAFCTSSGTSDRSGGNCSEKAEKSSGSSKTSAQVFLNLQKIRFTSWDGWVNMSF